MAPHFLTLTTVGARLVVAREAAAGKDREMSSGRCHIQLSRQIAIVAQPTPLRILWFEVSVLRSGLAFSIAGDRLPKLLEAFLISLTRLCVLMVLAWIWKVHIQIPLHR